MYGGRDAQRPHCRRSDRSDPTGEGGEPACKPGSVEDSHSSGTHVAVRLERPTRGHARAARRRRICMPPYLVLLRVGFTLPLMLPPARCALTAPFHPYRTSRRRDRRYLFCGTFRELASPRHYLAPCPAEPGLSSLAANGERDCPADSRARSIAPRPVSGLRSIAGEGAAASIRPSTRATRTLRADQHAQPSSSDAGAASEG
jgi:hypothetical protein